jgi:hypothetical protein
VAVADQVQVEHFDVQVDLISPSTPFGSYDPHRLGLAITIPAPQFGAA